MDNDGNDNARKDAARKRQKRTGEPYMRARREVMRRQPLTVTVGVDDAGRPVRVNLDQVSAGGSGPHCLIAGAGSSGKTVLAQQICRQLVAKRHATEVIVSAADSLRKFYGDGVAFLPAGGGPSVIVAALNDLVATREARLRQAQAADIDIARARGHQMQDAVVILDDEELWKGHHDSELAVERLIRVGRSVGIHMITVLTDPAVGRPAEVIRENSSTVLSLTAAPTSPGQTTIGLGICQFRRPGSTTAAVFRFSAMGG